MPSLTVYGANASSSKLSELEPLKNGSGSSVTESSPLFHRPLRVFAQWLFSVYHDIVVEGVEHIPAQGPAIIASNHPTYLDAAFLMVEMTRPVRFMAWEKPLGVPVLGRMMRAYGAIPVDMKKPGRGSFEAAVKVLRAGAVFGIFPEGGRTKTKFGMNPFKSGVARLALISGAPIIPATITGGRRVWRRGQMFPRPGKIRVVFHPPIHIDSSEKLKWRRDKSLERGVITQVMDTINRSYGPSLRKENRLRRLLLGRPTLLSPIVEGIPLAFLAGVVVAGLSRIELVFPIVIYAAWLALERGFKLKGRIVIWARHLVPWIAFCAVSAGVFSSFELIVGSLIGALSLIWLTIFRFPLYRRVRSLMLATAYGTLLLHLLGGVA